MKDLKEEDKMMSLRLLLWYTAPSFSSFVQFLKRQLVIVSTEESFLTRELVKCMAPPQPPPSIMEVAKQFSNEKSVRVSKIVELKKTEMAPPQPAEQLEKVRPERVKTVNCVTYKENTAPLPILREIDVKKLR